MKTITIQVPDAVAEALDRRVPASVPRDVRLSMAVTMLVDEALAAAAKP